MPAWTKDPLGASTGKYSGVSPFRKFGFNDVIDTTSVPEDVWSGGGIWVPPTQARVHELASTDAGDTETILISGLTDWNLTEESELITLQGTTPVDTTKSWVIIHRMVILEGNSNVGTITATAKVDGTVTARIEAGFAQTGMCIYGLGGMQNLLIQRFSLGMNRSGGSGGFAEATFLQDIQPTVDTNRFITAGYRTVSSSGTSIIEIPSPEGVLVTGPALLKVQVRSVGNNGTRVFASFGGWRYDK